MSFIESIKTVLSKYVDFTGRARRSEYWWFVLFFMIGNLVLGMVDSFLFGTTVVTDTSVSASTDTPILSGIFGLAMLLPSIAVGVRRLHDIDKSGWWLLVSFIPLIGAIVLIVWFATGGTRGPNRFGADPLDPDAPGGTPAHDGGAVYTASDIPNVPRD